jgi:hypothetical protein
MTARQLLLSEVSPEQAVTRQGFDRLLRETLESEIKIWPMRSFYPSVLGHPCDRHIVWRANRHDEQARYSVELQSIFDHGRDHQPLVYRRLEQLGFEVVRESDRPQQYRPSGPQGPVISGRPDGRVIGFRGTRYKPPYVLEAKSMSGYAFDGVATVDDLRHSPSHWTRSYYAQGQLYCFLEDVPHGIFVLISKQTGMLKLLPYELDYAYAEALLQRVERLGPMIVQGVDPEPIPYDSGVCGGCGFRGLCYPPRNFGEGASVLEDPALIEQLERRDALQAGAKEYDKLDGAVKARLKDEGIKFALAGPFVIEGKQIEKKIKAVEAHTRPETHYTIERAG